MCIYCSIRESGWEQLLEYDDVYQDALAEAEAERSNYGFDESWDELKEQVTPTETGTGR
ncbi:hypothetical protein [Halopelagius fulvigenes]|uniref:Uncharacterized protein n=1 Tax=Halopelagius fulvigenes TaxID=1198324 RepID=A0ABD5U2V5_9EURY